MRPYKKRRELLLNIELKRLIPAFVPLPNVGLGGDQNNGKDPLLDPARSGADLVFQVSSDGVWKDMECWADGVRLDRTGRLSLPPGARRILVRQGRLEMVQEIPRTSSAIVFVNVERLAKLQGPWLGVEFVGDGRVHPLKGGPAERAGIRSGDRILVVDGEPLPEKDGALRAAILHHAVGDVLPLDLERGEKRERLSLSVTLEKRPSSERR